MLILFLWLHFRYDSGGKVICRRKQLPIILCYATTVHKSQGLSADFVEVHADDLYYPGLLAVAISRARTVHGLRVVGFSMNCLVPPSNDLLKKLGDECHPTMPELTDCCLTTDTKVSQTDFNVEFSDESDEDYFNLNTPSALPHSPSASTSSSINSHEIRGLLAEQIIDKPVTEALHQINRDINYLQDSFDLTAIYDMIKEEIHGLYTSTICNNIKRNFPNGQVFNDFGHKCYTFISSELTLYLQSTSLKRQYYPYLKALSQHIQLNVISQQCKMLGDKSATELFRESLMPSSTAGDGTIRRVGGRTVYLMEKEVMVKIRSSYADIFESNYQHLKSVVKCIHAMMTSVAEVRRGKYPETAAETERRSSGGLTHITDDAFELFLGLEKARQLTQTVGNALSIGRGVLQNSLKVIKNDEQLIGKLTAILPSALSVDTDVVQAVWLMLLKKYLPVGNNTYRKKVLDTLKQTKTMAHRPRIAARGETSTEKRNKRSAAKVFKCTQ